MGIARAAYIVPAPGFIIRHVSFLDLDLALKSATLEWLEQSKTDPAGILANETICGARCFLFNEESGELTNEPELVEAFDNAYYHIEIAKKIHASLGEVDRPMALHFSVLEDLGGGLQFIVLPVRTADRAIRLLRIAGW
ncbi:hypothetical protein GCM10017083_46910 [Thalassobaculum fulvum]|uniref:Uncharacterized protein n=1 Tax=Thalassobaculum fulvum TaxID=1633335 RepID=A0A918XW32_9PROT|nr:hypothetical protein [Thalassobaculum fulvum]GHD60683.1 hypothetical protein GCM10017083_46910 [Thalassobaculum fulvum]